MTCQKIKLSIDSSLENVHLIGMAVNTVCSNVGLDKNTCFKLELCAVEAVNNCIIHAYRNTAGNNVSIAIEIFPDCLIFKVSDTGNIMSYSVDKTGLTFDPDDLASLPESKMGFFLINEIMDEFCYESTGGSNVLTMIKRI